MTYVNNLSEESEIFPYILNIDSGTGFYKKDSVYSFDMSNLNMIKKHLNDYFPDVLLFYSLINSDSIANTDSDNGFTVFHGIIAYSNYCTPPIF